MTRISSGDSSCQNGTKPAQNTNPPEIDECGNVVTTCPDEKIQPGNQNQCDNIDFSGSPVTGVVAPAIKHTYDCGDMTLSNVATIGVAGTTAKHVFEKHTDIPKRVEEQQNKSPKWVRALLGPVLGGWFND